MLKMHTFSLGKVCIRLQPVFNKIMGDMRIGSSTGNDVKTSKGFNQRGEFIKPIVTGVEIGISFAEHVANIAKKSPSIFIRDFRNDGTDGLDKF